MVLPLCPASPCHVLLCLQLVLRDARIRELERAHSEMRGRLQAALRRAAALNSAALAG
jgi:hypothetical protein